MTDDHTSKSMSSIYKDLHGGLRRETYGSLGGTVDTRSKGGRGELRSLSGLSGSDSLYRLDPSAVSEELRVPK